MLQVAETYKKTFLELQKDTVKYVPLTMDLTTAPINNEGHLHVASDTTLSSQTMSIMLNWNAKCKTCVTIDYEQNFKDSTQHLIKTLQLSFTNHKVTISHLSKLNAYLSSTLPI